MEFNNPETKVFITVIMAMSADGRITRGDDPDPRNWTSDEDKAIFAKQLEEAEVVIMGKTTFLAQKPSKIPKHQNRLTIVMTHEPEAMSEYQRPGIREFWDKPAPEVVDQLAALGYNKATLIGGANLNAQFFDAGLVSELYLTVEPEIFGKGLHVVEADHPLTSSLKLESLEVLNSKGTLRLHYSKN